MTLTYTAIPAAEQTAEQQNGPLIVPSNLIESAGVGEPFWNTGGLFSSTDLTDPVRTGQRACDYQLDLPFATNDTASAVYYANFEIDASEVDTVGIRLASVPSGHEYTIEIQFGDSTFADVATVARWTTVGTTARLIQSGLDYPEDSATAGVNRFTGIRYGRVHVVRTTGAGGPPAIGEILVGRRRGLSHAIETGADDLPNASDFVDTVTAGRKRFRYVLAAGYEDRIGGYTFGEHSVLGLDDYATLVAIRNESRSGSRGVWARWRTGGNWVLGFFAGNPPIELPIQSGAWTQRSWAFDFREQAPFARSET